MEWIDRLNSAIVYIEEHLTETLDYEALGRIACCSSYHFQRMFTYMAGIPLSEYIRRRKMSLAAVDLQAGQEKVIDIAAKYGYQSPTAFNRAFQSIHGIAPSAVRGEGVTVQTYPPITFQITIKGVEAMQYRIETKEAFRVVGISCPMARSIEQNFAEVPLLWQKAAMEGLIPRLIGKMDGKPEGILGICACCGNEDWKYYIAVSSTRPAEDLEEYIVPAFTWAVFPGFGECPGAIQELERRIVTEWLPTSGYEYADGPDVELYLSPDPKHAKFEVWIPVVRRK